MKLSKERLKQIINEEMRRLDEIEDSVTANDLVDHLRESIKSSMSELDKARRILEKLTREPHKLGSFVALQTRARMSNRSLEDLLERFEIAQGNYLRFKEEI
jgi:glutamyl-tRNA reductase